MTEGKKEAYSDLLKNPKWQKKRLENTLHVHHKIYYSGRKPWEYESRELITLCESCHEQEESNLKLEPNQILASFKRSQFLSMEWEQIYVGIEMMPKVHMSSVTASALHWFLTNNECVTEMVVGYFNHLNHKNNG